MRTFWMLMLAACGPVANDTGAARDTDTGVSDTGATVDTALADTASAVDTDPVDTGVSESLLEPEREPSEALDPNDSSEDPVAGVREAPIEGRRMWRLTFADEFNGPQPGDDLSCFDRTPRCVTQVSWGVLDCDPGYETRLAHLNKCTWAVWDFWNYMNPPPNHELNGFSPNEVTVAGGELLLTAHAHGSANKDCGNDWVDPRWTGFTSKTNNCPITSGGVHSRPEGIPGFEQLHGRFEVRARLSHGPGTWPAIWTLPTGGVWPDDGEIDIMEHWISSDERVAATFHDGIRDQVKVSDDFKWKGKRRYYPQSDPKDTFFEDYHTYAVEWDPDEMRFFVDKWLIGILRDGTVLEDRDGNEHPLEVPILPNYVLLNLTISPKIGTWLEDIFWDFRPDPDDFDPQTFHIDYVRVYEECYGAQACPFGGEWDGANCRIADAPATSFIDDHGRLVQEHHGAACPPGASQDDQVCVLQAPDPRAEPFLWGTGYYYRSVCQETTLSETCTDPCLGVGVHDGYGCYIDNAPNDLIADIDDGRFVYRKSWVGGLFGDPDCLPEHTLDDDLCVYGDVPSGRTAFTMDDDGVERWYVEGLCSVEHSVPDCAEPCPTGGWYDGGGCVVGESARGTNPFLYNGSMYYSALDQDPAWACTRGGTFDGANCRLGPLPPGANPRIEGQRFKIDAACARVPWWAEDGR